MTMSGICKKIVRSDLLAGVAVAGLLMMSQNANAQASSLEPVASGEIEADAAASNEIVVTARNREERLQDVPLAVTALSGDDLADAGVRNLREISYLTPGVTINSAGGEAYTQPIIRGLVNLNGGASDPNVAVFLDGIYLVNNSAISIGLINIERVEVVKGPVGSLYGHNGFAGAINYVTKKPGNDVAGNVSATIGNDGQRLITGSLSGPLIEDILSIGVAGGYEEYDGGYRDAVNGLKAGGYKKRDIHASFTLTPSDSIKLSGGFYYGDDHFDTVALVYAIDNCGPVNTGSAALGESTFTQYCGRLRFNPLEVSAVKPAAGAAGNDRQVYNANLRLDVDADFADLILLGGYNKVTQQRFEDFIGRRGNLVFNLTGTPTARVAAAELFGGDSNNEDYSFEARLTSKQDKPLRWAIGAYYYKNDFATSTLIGIDSSVLPAGRLFAGTAGQFATPSGQFSTSNLTYVEGTDQQTSGFASIDWSMTEKLILNGEFRYTHQAKSQDIIRNSFIANTVRPFGAPRSDSDNFINYRVSGKYQFSRDAMAYASVATGTKAFGFNSRASAFPGEVSFNPEYATAYEFGFKSQLLDNRLQLNAAAYLINTRNLQASVPSQDPSNTGVVTRNLGGTRAKGFEIEAVATPADWVRFNFGLGYVDAKFRSGAADFGSAAGCLAIPSCAPRIRQRPNAVGTLVNFVLLDGLKVPRVSPYQISAGVAFNGHLSDDVTWQARADFRFEDKQFMSANNYSFWGDRTLLNLRAGVAYQNITATVFVDNLTKNRTVESASANTRLNDFIANPVGFLPTARRFGVTLGYSF